MPLERDDARPFPTKRVALIAAAVMMVALGALLAVSALRGGGARGTGGVDPGAMDAMASDPLRAGPRPSGAAVGGVQDVVLASERGRIELFDDRDNVSQALWYERFEPMEQGRIQIDSPRALVRLQGGWTAEISAESANLLQRQSRREPESGAFRGDLRIHLFDRPFEEVDVPEAARPAPALSLFTESLTFNTAIGELRMPDRVRIEADGVAYDGRNATIIFSERDRKLLYVRVDETFGLRFDPALRRPEPERLARDGAEPREARARAPEPDNNFATDERDTHYRSVLSGAVQLAMGARTIDADRLEFWARTRAGALPAGAVRPLLSDVPTSSAAAANTNTGDASKRGQGDVGDDEPLTLAWTGPLEIRPTDETPRELSRDHLYARFSATGTRPVRVRDASMHAIAATPALEYGFTSRRLALVGTGPRSVEMRLEDRGEAVCSRFDADLGEGMAWITGEGMVRALGVDAARDISWRGRSDLRFETADGALTLREARFSDGALAREGDSMVSGESIAVDFMPGERARPRLSRVVIEDNARADAGADGRLSAQRIDVAFRAGARSDTVVPDVVTAAGDVRAEQGGSSLRAELVEAILSNVDGQARVETLNADLGVVVRTPQGGSVVEARADRMRALPAQRIVELTGAPASVQRDGGVVRGGSMRLEGEPQRLTVFGAGDAEYVRSDAERLMNYERVRVTWTNAMHFDDALGVVECAGGVEAVADAPDLSRDAARGERLIMRFTDSPRAGEDGASDEALLRRLSRVELFGPENGNAVIEARRYTADERAEAGIRLERMLHLAAPSVLLTADDQTLRVPHAGRLLIEDRRAPGAHGASPAGARGSTLFEWDGSLTLRRDTGAADMLQRVRLRHRPLGADAIVEMECENLRAVFALDDERLTRAEAIGAVYARRGGKQLIADFLRYDADTGEAEAGAAPGNVVTLFDEERPAPQTAQSIVWDLVRDRVRATGAGPVSAPR